MHRSTASSGEAPSPGRLRCSAFAVLALLMAAGCGERPGELFLVQATVSGLEGTGLVLQVNGGADVAVSGNGLLTLATLLSGSVFVVTVRRQPVNPAQTCTAGNNAGKVGKGNVTGITVVCAREAFTLGGTVTGLASGASVVLTNNGGGDITLSADGHFEFAEPVADGGEYAVVVKGQPSSPRQFCDVMGGAGTMAGEEVGNVSVACSYAWESVTVGGGHTLGIKSDGSLWAWGNNGSGQLGNGSQLDEHVPVRIGAAATWRASAAGASSTGAIMTDDSLWTWGEGTTSPHRVDWDFGWRKVSSSDSSFRILAIKANGSLWELTSLAGTPAQIGSATNWSSVSMGRDHIVATRSDGTLWAWRDNQYGALGVAGLDYSDFPTSPLQVNLQGSSDQNWARAEAGVDHTVGIRKDGTLWAWGENYERSLSVNTTAGLVNVPMQVGVQGVYESDWAAVSGGSGIVAIKTNGTLWEWGTGTGPTRIGADQDWVFVTAGANHNAAIKSDGTLWTWGLNTSGQLGDGTTTDRPAPVRVR